MLLLSWKLQDGEIPVVFIANDGSDDIGRGIRKYYTSHHAGGGTKMELTTIEMADSVLAATVKSCNDLIIANMNGNLSKYMTLRKCARAIWSKFSCSNGFWCTLWLVRLKVLLDPNIKSIVLTFLHMLIWQIV